MASRIELWAGERYACACCGKYYISALVRHTDSMQERRDSFAIYTTQPDVIH